MFDKLAPRDLFQVLLHVIITLLNACMCEGAKDTDIERLELVGGMWGEREENDIVFLCKIKDIESLMGSMAIIDKENRFPRCVLCLSLGNKDILEPFKAMEVTCPPVVRKSNTRTG
jgi:hypothetical protein